MHSSSRLRGSAAVALSAILFLSSVVAGLVATPSRAAADPGAAERARALLQRIATERSATERSTAATELAALGSPAITELVAFLGRERQSAEEERRSVLQEIKADVPDKDGRFRLPGRKETVNSGDDFDWLGALVELDPELPGLGEVIADVAAIRALAATKDIAGAEAILDFGFTEPGLIYRDECGRYLRKMAPYSLPALITASQNEKEKDASLRRYANYQLDRLDRQDPHKALNHASVDHRLEIAVLDAYGQSKHREAVVPLIGLIDAPAPAVRKAAREALLSYVTGPPPPPAPKRKLTLPGGRLTDKEEPLWLTYRELAEEHLRRTYEEVLGKKPSSRASGEELVRALMAHYDDLRQAEQAKKYEAATALASAGNWAEATQEFDRLLAENPDHPERATMARAYLEHAKSLYKKEEWDEAAAAYSKAHGLSPEADFANEALAGHYLALGKALEAHGKDGSAAFRQAAALAPSGKQAEEVRIATTDGARSSRWMLYAGLGGGASALILLILGLAVRRRA